MKTYQVRTRRADKESAIFEAEAYEEARDKAKAYLWEHPHRKLVFVVAIDTEKGTEKAYSYFQMPDWMREIEEAAEIGAEEDKEGRP